MNEKDNILWYDIESTALELHLAKIRPISFLFNGNKKTITGISRVNLNYIPAASTLSRN